MHIRAFRPADLPELQRLFASSPFPYDFPDLKGPHIEAVLIVESEDGRILMAAAAERIVQLYLWSAEFEPAAKLHAIRLLHQHMAPALRDRGYREVNAFLPPVLARQFGRRLAKTFGWIPNWISWAKRF